MHFVCDLIILNFINNFNETLLECNSAEGLLQAVFFIFYEHDGHANYVWNQH